MSQSLQQVKSDPSECTFTPLGNTDPIKLSLGIIERQIANPTRSGKMPTKRDMMDFLMLCRARKLNPFEGDAFLVGYDGQAGASFSLITGQQAFLKRSEACPQFDGMESGLIIIDQDGNQRETEGDFLEPGCQSIGAWARVHRSDQKFHTYRRLNIEKYDTGRSMWKKNREMMAVKCAEADALRSAFPSVNGGLYSQDEIQDIPRSIDISPAMLTSAKPNDDSDTEFAPSKQHVLTPKHDNQIIDAEQSEAAKEPDALISQVFDVFEGHLDGVRAYAVSQGWISNKQTLHDLKKTYATGILANPEALIKIITRGAK